MMGLPIKTGFPLHFNAVFALTPDRQSLNNVEEAGLPESRERYVEPAIYCHLDDERPLQATCGVESRCF